MPRNVPPELEDKFRSCKEKLIADGKSEDSAYAICYTSVVEGKSMHDALKLWADGKLRDLAAESKVGAMISAPNKKKMQAIHDMTVELGAACGNSEGKSISPVRFMKLYEMGGEEYAQQEGYDIQQACSALMQVAGLVYNEAEEPDISKVAAIMRGLVDFIRGEIDEMEGAALSGQMAGKSNTQRHDYMIEGDRLNLSYVKSMLGNGTLPQSMAVKFIGRNTIKGYTFLWGNPNLTDVEIEYFTKDSNFWDDRLGKSPRPLTWDHAQDKDFKASPVIGNIVDFGDDELGRWYVAKLDVAHQYQKAIVELINKGVLGTSSDSAPQYVVREKTGKSVWLKEWPWFASALTNTPAEPRMIGSLEFLKSLGINLPDVSVNSSRLTMLKRQSDVLKLKKYQTPEVRGHVK